MTITEPLTEPTTDTDAEGVSVEPELCWLNLADLAAHPDNPRASLGDLTEGSGFHLMRGSRLSAGSGCWAWSETAAA